MGYYQEALPPYLTCPGCGGKKDYYAAMCRTCRKPKPSEYRSYPHHVRDGIGKGLHVAIAERALGKALPKGAHVHHVNGCRGDSRNANLVICQDAAYHSLLHKRARIVKAGGNPNTQRICSYCKELKQLDEMITQGANHPRGLIGTACKKCVAKRSRAWWEKKKTQATA